MRRTLASFLFIGIAQVGTLCIPQIANAYVLTAKELKDFQISCSKSLINGGISDQIAPAICKEHIATMYRPTEVRDQKTWDIVTRFKLENKPGDTYYESVDVETWRNRLSHKARVSDEEFRAAAEIIHGNMIPNNGAKHSNYFPKRTTHSRPITTTTSSPSRPVAQASDSIHEKCLPARDYKGCIDSFTGRRSSSSSSDYEERMLELKRQELEELRRAAREQEEREYARDERRRKREAMKLFQDGLNDITDAIRGPDIINCSTSHFGINSFSTCH